MATVIIAVLIGVVVYSLWQESRSFHNHAQIAAVGVDLWADEQCTINASETGINWGVFDLGETKNDTIWASNPGTVPITLSFVTGNWQPIDATKYISLSWSYTGAVMQPADVTPLTFYCTVALNTTGFTAFNYTITVTGTQHK